MALFDDPKKELKRLEQQLLAEEEKYEEEEILEGLLEEYADIEDCFEEDYQEEYEAYAPQYRNFANDYGRAMTEALWEEEQDSDRAVYRDDYQESRKKKKKKNGVGEAIFLILLDIVLIGILYWGWLQWRG